MPCGVLNKDNFGRIRSSAEKGGGALIWNPQFNGFCHTFYNEEIHGVCVWCAVFRSLYL